MVDPATLPHEVGEKRALAEPGLRFKHEIAVVVGFEKAVDLRLEPPPTGEALKLHPFKDRPRIDIGVLQALVAANEERVAVACYEELSDDVPAGGDTAAISANAALDPHLVRHGVASPPRGRAHRR